jgi:hypothetical protein
VKQRVEQNTADGGAVIAALVEQGMSYREIERATASRMSPRTVGPPRRRAPSARGQLGVRPTGNDSRPFLAAATVVTSL